MHDGLAGTCAGLVAPSRRSLLDRTPSTRCSTWPRCKCAHDHRYGAYVVIYYNTEFIFSKGNCDDEGSLFSISTINISYVDKCAFFDLRSASWFYSTTAQVKEYLGLFMMPKATDEEINGLLVHYPDDLRAGCPFDTGIKNALGKPSSERAVAESSR